ncbi:MAG: sigma-54 dependent transcriptional regulator [Planctomycetota bacterium]
MSGTNRSVLVVDDDVGHRTMLAQVLGDLGVQVELAADGELALARLAARVPDMMLLDMRMPGMTGLDVLAAMRARGMQVPTVVLTAHADLDDAVRAMKLGARDYLRKPIDLADLGHLVDQHLGRASRDADLPALPEGVVVESPLMLEVLRELARVAATDAPVLLTGETGTGKEVLADLLHRWSRRASGPLVAVNVAALPETLVESELFGHQAGAFTGADRAHVGRIAAADGGTLFLDEIGEMPAPLQPKLLRVLQSKRILPLGGSAEREVDFRLISATNRDLEAEVAAGRFRKDLYYRMAVIALEVPPLRERAEDVLLLARTFLRRGAERKRLAASTERALLAHTWPGNIRELENAVQRAAILAPGDTILPEHLPPTMRGAEGPKDPDEPAAPLSLAVVERRAILEMLAQCGGNRSEAARRLGISRRKLLYRLKEYGV